MKKWRLSRMKTVSLLSKERRRAQEKKMTQKWGGEETENEEKAESMKLTISRRNSPREGEEMLGLRGEEGREEKMKRYSLSMKKKAQERSSLLYNMRHILYEEENTQKYREEARRKAKR